MGWRRESLLGGLDGVRRELIIAVQLEGLARGMLPGNGSP